jgi:hypothetical protein
MTAAISMAFSSCRRRIGTALHVCQMRWRGKRLQAP